MNHFLILFLIIFILNFFLFRNNHNIAFILNLFDTPNVERKFHLKPTPLNGGIFYFLNLIIIFIYDFFFYDSTISLFFELKNEIIFIYFLVINFILLSLGIIDDKLSIRPLSKTLISLIIFIAFLIMNKDFQIIKLKFESFDKEIDLFEISFIFTVISFATLQICLNMYDGMNLQSSIYYKVLILFFLVISNDPGLQLFCLFTLIYLLFFSFYNYRGLIFFGDNGVYIFSFIISLIVIKLYNSTNSLNVENILIIFLFPFLDLIRLFLYRLRKNLNPFEADRSHIHHILLKRYGLVKTNLIIISPLIVSMLLFHLLKMNLILLIIVNFIIYIFIIKQKVND